MFRAYVPKIWEYGDQNYGPGKRLRNTEIKTGIITGSLSLGLCCGQSLHALMFSLSELLDTCLGRMYLKFENMETKITA